MPINQCTLLLLLFISFMHWEVLFDIHDENWSLGDGQLSLQHLFICSLFVVCVFQWCKKFAQSSCIGKFDEMSLTKLQSQKARVNLQRQASVSTFWQLHKHY